MIYEEGKYRTNGEDKNNIFVGEDFTENGV